MFGQGNTTSQASYSLDKEVVTSALEVAQAYGFGSPLHLAVLQLLPINGDGVGIIPVNIFPLKDDGAGVAAEGDITPSGTPTRDDAYRVYINEIPSEKFLIEKDATVAQMCTAMHEAIAAALNVPMTSTNSTTKVDLASKWKGESANKLKLRVDGPADAGVSFAFTQPTGGAANPAIDAALLLAGDIWYTKYINCLNMEDSDALDAFATFDEGRRGALTHKPAKVYTGWTEDASGVSTSQASIVIPDARKTDRTNVQLVAPASDDLPFVVAARQVARIAKRANVNPPWGYGGLQATGLDAGPDADQWNAIQRGLAVQGGSSTITVVDGIVQLSDIISFYHPTGDMTPAYRFDVDDNKVSQVIFNTELIFAADQWMDEPLVPDADPTANPATKKPKNAVTAISNMIDKLAEQSILSDPATAKATVKAQINETNPKRLDVAFTVQISGNTGIISIDFNWGFFYGTAIAA